MVKSLYATVYGFFTLFYSHPAHLTEEKLKPPLLPEYALDAGTTEIDRNGELDFIINRPNGMNGYMLHLTLEGEGELLAGEQTIQLKQGDLLLLPPEFPHNYQRDQEAAKWKYRWIYFRPRTFWLDWLNWSVQQQGVGRLPLSSESALKQFEGLFSDVADLINSGRALAQELAMNRLEQLLLLCTELQPQNEQRLPDPRIIDVCEYILQHLREPLKTEDIAAHVTLSVSRLTHLFTEQVGMSLSRWREEQRISLAKQLLQTTGMPIYNVARRVGYDDQLYFSKVFRRRTGVCPTQFRESS